MAPRPGAVRRLTNAPPGRCRRAVQLVVADRRAHLRSVYRFQVSRQDGPFREAEDGEATVSYRTIIPAVAITTGLQQRNRGHPGRPSLENT